MATAAEAVSAVAAAATIDMVVANNNRNCGGRQQSTKWGRGQRSKQRQRPLQRQLLQRGCDGRQGHGGVDAFKSPLSFWHDDKGGGMGRVLREKLATWNLKI